MRKVKKGDVLFLAGEGSRRQCTVKSVGSKYITVDSGLLYGSTQFYVETWRQVTPYTPDYHLYESEQEWKDEMDLRQYWDAFQVSFRSWRNEFTLDQLKEAAVILGIKIGE